MNAEDNNNGSKPAEEQHHELPNSELLARLSNYTLVNSLFQQYNNIKAASPLLKVRDKEKYSHRYRRLDTILTGRARNSGRNNAKISWNCATGFTACNHQAG